MFNRCCKIFTCHLRAACITGAGMTMVAKGVATLVLLFLFSFSSFAAEDSTLTWYSEQENITADENLFFEKGNQEMTAMQDHLNKLRKQDSFHKDENQKAILEAEKRLNFAEKRLKILKSSSGSEQARVRQETEKALGQLDQELKKASKSMLSEEEYFTWQLQSQLRDREYQEQQMQAVHSDPNWGNKDKLDKKIQGLTEKRESLDKKIEEYEKTKSEIARKKARKELEEEMKSLDKEYKETLSRTKRTQEPVIKTLN